jgi:hypothetical protein
MDLQEAFDEVLAAARLPKQHPPEATPKELIGEAAMEAVDAGQLRAKAWHESLTPAQETVCRWIWETCVQYHKPWEPFEAGFLYDYNIDHELAMWVRIAHVFSEFLKRHPSVDKRLVIGELVGLSMGIPIRKLKGGRAKELKELWREPPQG